MRTLCTYVLVMSTGLLSGCAVGPDYQRPDAPLPDRYLTQPRGAANITAHPLVSAAWWDGFDDPLLSSFVSRALAQNLDLAQASAQLAQARAGADAATAAPAPVG
ncbi:RND efflux system, outer membrane lipoprotein, NodT, partial [Pseudomonas syringae pv. pisi str. 1704B]